MDWTPTQAHAADKAKAADNREWDYWGKHYADITIAVVSASQHLDDKALTDRITAVLRTFTKEVSSD